VTTPEQALMKSATAVFAEEPAAKPVHPDLPAARLGLVSFLALSTWCGLVAGLLEVGTVVASKQTFDSNQLYGMSHHFVWLIPMANVGIFVALGVLGCLIGLAWRRGGRWLRVRALCALVLLPVLLVAFPRVYGLAWLVVAIGFSARLVPLFERHSAAFVRFVRVSFPVAVGVVAIMAASVWVGEWLKRSRERGRPLPPPESPSVLLVVMDTVTAGRLDLHNYARPTSTTLRELAQRGIRFDSARSASSWTLASHATMFTGRWLHELSVGWLTPLDRKYPTLAEFLGARGYATAGFVANKTYCGRDSGLARGFTHYEDYIFPNLTCFKIAVLVNRTLTGIQAIEDFLEEQLAFAFFRPYLKYLWWLLDTDRKGAAVINRQFVDWLAERGEPERPFFAFLNYYDAHDPYQLAPGRMHRFGAVAIDESQRDLILKWADLDKTSLSPQEIDFAVRAYDECVADLDEQLGILVDDLERRGALEQTWLFIVSDHGESFGEHAGVYCHGTSLYQTEVHVPLLIIPPRGGARQKVVDKTVSLRDLPATVIDVLGMTADSPFPGDSLARFWDGAPASSGATSSSPGLAELVPSDPVIRDPSKLPKNRWPLGGLADGNWSYIRREGEVREELFHLRNDAKEERNLADDPAARLQLERMRTRLGELTAGPLLPGRFNP
jgi:arylsulfatase A-like enzyme